MNTTTIPFLGVDPRMLGSGRQSVEGKRDEGLDSRERERGTNTATISFC